MPAIESLHIGPSQPCNLHSEPMPSASELWMGLEERRQLPTEIPQCPGSRWRLLEIGEDESIELLRSQDGREGWAILCYRCNHSEPVLAVINLETLKRRELRVRLDVASGEVFDRATVLTYPPFG